MLFCQNTTWCCTELPRWVYLTTMGGAAFVFGREAIWGKAGEEQLSERRVWALLSLTGEEGARLRERTADHFPAAIQKHLLFFLVHEGIDPLDSSGQYLNWNHFESFKPEKCLLVTYIDIDIDIDIDIRVHTCSVASIVSSPVQPYGP